MTTDSFKFLFRYIDLCIRKNWSKLVILILIICFGTCVIKRDNCLTISGLFLNIIGSWFLIKSLIISNEKAVELGKSRVAGSTYEDNLKLEPVRDRIKQRNNAIWGAVFLILGFIFQVIAQLY